MVELLTGFADEISGDLGVQLETLAKLQIGGIDVRSVDGKNVLALSPAELAEVRKRAHDAGIVIACVGSPVNKVDATPSNRPLEREKLLRAIEASQHLETKRIRLFTPEKTEDSSDEEILDWMQSQVDLAVAADVILLHENDAKFWGAYPDNARRLFETLGSPRFRAAFDFANTVLIGFDPVEDWLPWIVPYLDTLHIKDATRDPAKVVPAGEGDGRMVEFLRALRSQDWTGRFTMEPHLSAAGPFGGFSGPQLFEVATTAFRRTLEASEA